MVKPVLPLAYEIDYRRAGGWRANMTSHWLKKCGFEANICKLFLDNNITGPFLLNLTFDVLTDDLKIPVNIANEIYAYIGSLRNALRYQNNDDSAMIDRIKITMSKYENELKKLEEIEFKAKNNLNEVRNKQKSKDNDNKAMKDYEIKLKCIQMSKSGVSKKDISKTLNKPINWVNKFSRKNAHDVKKPNTKCKIFNSKRKRLQFVCVIFVIIWFFCIISFFYFVMQTNRNVDSIASNLSEDNFD